MGGEKVEASKITVYLKSFYMKKSRGNGCWLKEDIREGILSFYKQGDVEVFYMLM